MSRCSIVIPVHGHCSLTRQCLDAILDTTGDVAPEIIVVDDASRDHTSAMLAEYAGRVRVVSRAVNGGFAVACNDGARAASGDSVLFLNNDTIPQRGWLEPLLRVLSSDPRVAAVGSKLVYPNGTIQHAGVVICYDRFPRQLYNGFAADHPAVNRPRRFQIVSGAAILVRRTAFDEIGGFDTTFVNAYEDHDLCLRLGERGYHVWYCPESVAVHLEGATRAARIAEQDHATWVFRTRWADRLEPDEMKYYVDDGLLRIDYSSSSYPLRVAISPMLATLDEEVRGREAERLLAVRSRQVRDLVRQNADLSARALSGRAAPAALAAPVAPNSVAVDDAGDPLTPPDDLAYWVGPTDFAKTGDEYVHYFVSLGGLKPSDAVLDIGCGVGRMALPLTRYLAADAVYEGFDPMADLIRWCQDHITPRFPNFRFRHLDVRSGFYNREGRAEAATVRFPYEDSSFDFVFLTSVFTHMLPDQRDRYLDEIARVLKPGGRCFATFFLLNDESLALIRAGLSPDLAFPYRLPGCRVHARDVPESAVAYEEADVRAAYAARGLDLTASRYGTWCSRLSGLAYQDMIVSLKS